MGIDLTHYLTLAAIVFTIGVAGIILNHKNIIIILMSSNSSSCRSTSTSSPFQPIRAI